jgi:hypothetical protein
VEKLGVYLVFSVADHASIPLARLSADGRVLSGFLRVHQFTPASSGGKEHTSDLNNYSAGSHAMQYGDKTFKDELWWIHGVW